MGRTKVSDGRTAKMEMTRDFRRKSLNTDGEIFNNEDILLSECPISSTIIIRQVPDEDSEILIWLKHNGVSLGQKMYIKSKNNFDDSLVVEINNSLIEISSNMSKLVYVTIE